MANSLPIPAVVALRRRLKSLASGNRQRQQINENTLRTLENGLARAIKDAKADFIHSCADAYISHREQDFHTQLITHQTAVSLILAQQAKRVIPTFGRATLTQIRGSVKCRRRFERKAAGDDSLFNRLIQQWLGQRKQMASDIAQTTLNDVLNAVQGGIDDGDGTDEIARSIRGVTALSPYRSMTVARTETHAAANFAQIESARQAESDLGIKLQKTWLATLDNRTRETHADADGQTVMMDEKFIVGGVEMDRPGDPSAPADLVINCRCTTSFSQGAS